MRENLILRVKDVTQKAFDRGSFLRNIAVLSSGSLVGQVLTLAFSPLITRIYPASELGLIGLVMSFVGFGLNISSLKYDVAIVSESEDEKAQHLFEASLLIATFSSFLLTLGFYPLVKFELLGFGEAPLMAMPLIGVILLVSAYSAILTYTLIRRERFQPVSQHIIGASITKNLSQTGLGLLFSSWYLLAAGELLSRIVSVAVMLRYAPVKVSKLAPRYWLAWRAALYKNRRFVTLSLPSSLIDTLVITLPLPLITQRFDTEAAGYYFLVYRVVMAPTSLIGSAIRDAFHGRIARYHREAPGEVLRFVVKNILLMGGIGLFPFLIFTFWGPQIFELVFGEDWRTAGVFAQILAPWALASFVVGPLSRVLLVFNQQGLKFIYDILGLGILVGTFTLSSFESLPLGETLKILSFSNVGAYGVYLILITYALMKGVRSRKFSPENE